MNRLAPWIPTMLCSWLLAASIGYKRPQVTPKLHPVCQSEKPAYHFDWEDSVYARNRAYFNSLRSSQQAEGQ